MPLFEDDTLEGVIRKAVRGLRPEARWPERIGGPMGSTAIAQRKSSFEETFNNQSFGSTIGGTGQSGFASRRAAAEAAANTMERLAVSHYPDRVAAIRRGRDEPRFMIPELATLVEYYQPNPQDNEHYLWRFLDLHVGKVNRQTGRGDFEISPTTNMTDLVHAHWADNNPSGQDRSIRSRLRGLTRGRTYPDGSGYEMGFYLYSFSAGLDDY